jgi:hypothetical protein
MAAAVVLCQLVRSASGKLGDLLLDAPQSLHLILKALRDLSVLAGHQDTMLADGVASHGYRSGDSLQGQVGDRLVTSGAEDEADASAILAVGDERVDGVDVQVHLAHELRLEGAELQIDDHEAAGRVVEEEEIEDELLAADLERLLTSSEVEALAQGQHEALDVLQQRRFQVALLGTVSELHEVQDHGITHDPLHSLGITGLQSLLEVRDRRTLTLVQATRDGRLELRSRPRASSLGVPVPGRAIGKPVQQSGDVTPR